MRINIFIILVLVFASGAVYNLHLHLDTIRPPRTEILSEMMYFPSGRFLRVAICDFDILFANLVWLRAIQYYGQHALTDYQYEWLPHIFDILTSLDPRFMKGYRFGGVIISEDAGQPGKAREILRRGLTHLPMCWEIPFDIGFIYYTIDKDYHNAAKYFKLASLREGPHGRAIRFAAHSFRMAKEWDSAKRMWRKVLEKATIEKKKQLAEKSIRYIQMDEEVDRLRGVVCAFQKKEGRIPKSLGELVSKRYLKNIPKDPLGGRYLIRENGDITTTTYLLDELEFTVRYLNQRLTAYQTAKGEFPEVLDDLVEEGFIGSLPPHSFGKEYLYIRSEGRVVIPVKRRM